MAKGKGLYTYTVAEAQNIGLGQSGYKNVTHGNDTGTGEFCAIYSYHDTTTVTTESDDVANFPNLSAVVLPAGTWLYGRWTKVTIGSSSSTTGKALVYKG